MVSVNLALHTTRIQIISPTSLRKNIPFLRQRKNITNHLSKSFHFKNIAMSGRFISVRRNSTRNLLPRHEDEFLDFNHKISARLNQIDSITNLNSTREVISMAINQLRGFQLELKRKFLGALSDHPEKTSETTRRRAHLQLTYTARSRKLHRAIDKLENYHSTSSNRIPLVLLNRINDEATHPIHPSINSSSDLLPGNNQFEYADTINSESTSEVFTDSSTIISQQSDARTPQATPERFSPCSTITISHTASTSSSSETENSQSESTNATEPTSQQRINRCTDLIHFIGQTFIQLAAELRELNQ